MILEDLRLSKIFELQNSPKDKIDISHMHNKFAQKQLNLFRQNIFFCWTLHLLTSFGIICSFFALKNIIDGEIFKAFMWLGLGLLIDGIDGTIARFLRVSVKLPHIDGHMLDSIIDYINYIFIPAFMLHHFKILPETMDTVLPATIMVISVISYSNKNTKTDENCYIGFPAIWNVVVLYLVILDYSVLVNTAILISLIILKIVPIRFVHPFRTKSFKKSTLVVSLSWFMLTPFTVISREYSYLSDYYEYSLSAWLLISSYYVFLTLFLNSDKFAKIYKFTKKFRNTNKISSCKNDLSAEKI